MMRTLLMAAIAGLGLLLCSSGALAHKGSDAYLDVQQMPNASDVPARHLRLTLAVALRDLDLVLPLDANADGKVTWAETRNATPAVLRLLNQVVQLEPGSDSALPAHDGAPACRLDWRSDGLEQRSDGAYLRAVAQTDCPEPNLRLRYTLLQEQDATHRLLVAGQIGTTAMLTTGSPQQQGPIALTHGSATPGAQHKPQATDGHASGWSALRDYFQMGGHHLLQGYDHLAFLLALVLPLRLALWAKAQPSNSATAATWWTLLRTITAFTVGHSITLVLATLGWTSASPNWVEPTIALSIGVTALLNIRPVRWIRTDVLALLFGMVHGYGFAGLLLEAAAPDGLLPWALTGFNLGVEAGQLIAVASWVILSQPLVGQSWYGTAVVRGGSVLLMLLAAWWFVQRVTGWF